MYMKNLRLTPCFLIFVFEVESTPHHVCNLCMRVNRRHVDLRDWGIRPMILRSLSVQREDFRGRDPQEAMGLTLESKQDTAEKGVTGRFQAEAMVCVYEGLGANGVLVKLSRGLNKPLQSPTR